MASKNPKILYLVHDLSDSAVKKRVRMLIDGGATVTIMGFYRDTIPPTDIHGCKTIPLSRTFDGKFIHRILTTLRSVLSARKYKKEFNSADIIIARPLEMLSIAVRGRSLNTNPVPLVYESLDIHRLLLNQGPAGKTLRCLEGWLSHRASLLITSSPAFIREYFEKISSVKCPTLLLENKVYEHTPQNVTFAERPPTPPWRIGWFGAIRCRKSLAILTNLVKAMDGKVEVIIRGKPSLDQFEDFYRDTSNIKGLHFEGPYKNPDDLEKIYNEIHFTWAIDMFEEGLNSSWLLPNRIYEGGRYNSIPIARTNVETGKTITRIGTGITLDDPLAENLLTFFQNLTLEHYTTLQNKARQVPIKTWLMSGEDSAELVTTLTKLRTV